MQRRLFAPIDITYLVWFRVGYGIALLANVYLFYRWDMIQRYFIEPKFHYKYFGFGWVEPLSPVGMNWGNAAR